MTTALRQWLSAQSFLPDSDRARIGEQRITVTAAGGGVQVIQRQFANPLSWLFLASAVFYMTPSRHGIMELCKPLPLSLQYFSF